MIKVQRPFDARSIRLVIFDLDGTLVDSRLDLVHSVNAMLRNFDRPELPEAVIASYVGDGAPMLVRRALGDPTDEVFFKAALTFFLAYYRVHKLDFTHVYDGVKEMLAAIHATTGRKVVPGGDCGEVHPSAIAPVPGKSGSGGEWVNRCKSACHWCWSRCSTTTNYAGWWKFGFAEPRPPCW